MSGRGRAAGLLALEPSRAVGEFGLFGLAGPWLRRAPRGDGHPVLVMPGFGTTDVYTRPLRGFLRGLGYHVHGFRLGRNIPSEALVDGLRERMERLVSTHADTPISIVGWSLGGLYGREIARHAPERVRQVVTLGTPFRDPRGVVSPVLDGLRTVFVGDVPDDVRLDERPPPVPVSAIYSRSDDIVPWPIAVEAPAAQSESIEVVASHCGLPHNPAALWAIADRLAQPVGTWQPFEPTGTWRRFYVRRD